MRSALIAVCLSIFVVACSGFEPHPDGTFPFQYLKYCGDNHPVDPFNATDVSKRSDEELRRHVKWLLTYVDKSKPKPGDKSKQPDKPGPLDDIDRICMFHDICYAIEGRASPACDAALAFNAKLVMDNLKPAKNNGNKFLAHIDEHGRPVDECYDLAECVGAFGLTKFASISNPMRVTDPLKALLTPLAVPGPAIQFITYVNAGHAGACFVDKKLNYVAPYTMKEYSTLVACYKVYGDNLEQCKSLPAIRRRQ